MWLSLSYSIMGNYFKFLSSYISILFKFFAINTLLLYQEKIFNHLKIWNHRDKTPEFTDEKTKAQRDGPLPYILLPPSSGLKSRWPHSHALLSTFHTCNYSWMQRIKTWLSSFTSSSKLPLSMTESQVFPKILLSHCF